LNYHSLLSFSSEGNKDSRVGNRVQTANDSSQCIPENQGYEKPGYVRGTNYEAVVDAESSCERNRVDFE
jgi:hypothetical protein